MRNVFWVSYHLIYKYHDSYHYFTLLCIMMKYICVMFYIEFLFHAYILINVHIYIASISVCMTLCLEFRFAGSTNEQPGSPGPTNQRPAFSGSQPSPAPFGLPQAGIYLSLHVYFSIRIWLSIYGQACGLAIYLWRAKPFSNWSDQFLNEI